MRQNLLIAPICVDGHVNLPVIHGLIDVFVMNLRSCSNLDIDAPLFLNNFLPNSQSSEFATLPSEIPHEVILQSISQFESEVDLVLFPMVTEIRHDSFILEFKVFGLESETEIHCQRWQGKLLEVAKAFFHGIRLFVVSSGGEYNEKDQKWPITENCQALELFLQNLYYTCCFQIEGNLNDGKKVMENIQKIVSNFQKVLHLDPNLDLAAYRLLGFIDDLFKNPFLPRDAYRIALKTLQEIDKNRSFQGEVYLAVSSVFQTIGNEKKALQNLIQARKKSPENPEIIVALGNYYEKKKELIKAKNIYQRFLKEYPDHSFVVTHNLGTILAEMGHLDRALSYWMKSLQQNQSVSGTYINLMNAYFERKEYDKMWIVFEESLRHPPVAWSSYEHWIRNLEEVGDYTSAITSLREYLQKNPEDGGVYYYLGLLFQLQKRQQKALSIWQQGLALKEQPFHDAICQEILNIRIPGFEEKFMEKSSKVIAGKPKESMAFFQECTLEVPEFWQGWYFLGKCHARLNEFQYAFDCFDRAIQIEAENTLVLTELGIVSILLDKKEFALDCFRKVAVLAPNIPDHLSNLAIALMESNEFEQAEWALQRAMDLKPNDSVFLKIQEILANLRSRISNASSALSDRTKKRPKHKKKIRTQFKKPAQE